MLIARNDGIRLAVKGAINELVIAGVFQNDLEPMIRLDDLRAADKEREETVDLGSIKAGIQASSDSVVFIDDFRRANHLELSFCPGINDFRRSPAPEKAGDQHIGVNDDSHSVLRLWPY